MGGLARYFLSRISPDAQPGGVGPFWRLVQPFGGFVEVGKNYADVLGEDDPAKGGDYFHTNLSLLAAAVGDDPRDVMQPSDVLAAERRYTVKHRGVAAFDVAVQPWVRTVPTRFGMVGVSLPIGERLASFLDDPVGVGSLRLGLPFREELTTLSGAWLRPPKSADDPGSAFHGGSDFSVQEVDGEPRPLIDVCAAADGVVSVLLNVKRPNGGVVLRHEAAPGRVFQTIYQHLEPGSVTARIGDRIGAGQMLGRIRRQGSGSTDRSHLHFGLGVQGPAFTLGTTTVPALWYLLDPFGVYDYHEPDRESDYLYIPRPRGGLSAPVRGAERVVHWGGNPLIEVLPGELRTRYLPVRQVQVRVRSQARSGGEQDQMLVWLDGVDGFFLLATGSRLDRPIERESCRALTLAHAHRLKVSVAYRYVAGERRISAAWLRR